MEGGMTKENLSLHCDNSEPLLRCIEATRGNTEIREALRAVPAYIRCQTAPMPALE